MNKHIICEMGKFDVPIVQNQSPFKVDLLRSNIALFGSSMSGKTNFLRALIHELHKKMNPKNERIFILDFSGGLLEYKKFPLVSAYFDSSNEEYVKRVFKILETILKENIAALGSKNYSTVSENQPPHTTFIIDNLNSFVDENRYAAYHEKFGRLCREGRSRGITIVFSASDTKGVSRYLLSFEQKVALNLPADKYLEIFDGKADAVGNISGRGYANITEKLEDVTGTYNMNAPYEVQCLKAADIEQENSEFMLRLHEKYQYAEHPTEPYGLHVKRYLTFDRELRSADFERLAQPLNEDEKNMLSANAIPVGLDYIDFKPVYADPDKSRVIAIYGKKQFGKTNLLSRILENLVESKSNARFLFFDDGREQLNDFYKKYRDKVTCDRIHQFEVKDLQLEDGSVKRCKLSPIQQFYLFVHEHVMNLKDPNALDGTAINPVYGVKNYETDLIPDGMDSSEACPVVFIIQSKSVYLNAKNNTYFLRYLFSELLDIAEERDFCFLFTDVQKITDQEANAVFNSMVKTVFLLDNIAEFAGERGSKSVFGEMDVKALKEEYARCELGDGYSYDVEADSLKKMKFILHE